MPDLDLSEFDQIASPKTRRACKVAIARENLTDDDRAKLDAAVTRYPSGVVEKWLRERGHDVSNSAVTNHRNRRCACADA